MGIPECSIACSIAAQPQFNVFRGGEEGVSLSLFFVCLAHSKNHQPQSFGAQSTADRQVWSLAFAGMTKILPV